MSIKSQRDNWSCVTTALGYMTGIDIEKIQEEIGHDGGVRWKDIQDKIDDKKSPFDYENEYRIGMYDQEILWWAFNNGYNAHSLTTFEEMKRIVPYNRWHCKIYCPTQKKLYEKIQGKIALLTVDFDPQHSLGHIVVWLGDIVLYPDPSRKEKLTIEHDQIRSAIIFNSIELDPRKRKKELGY